MTELDFLIDILLNHKLPKATKDLVAERIKEVGARAELAPRRMTAPTKQEIFDRSRIVDQVSYGEVPGMIDPIIGPTAVTTPYIPLQEIAKTQMAASAIASREQAIAESISGKIDKVTGRPRKF